MRAHGDSTPSPPLCPWHRLGNEIVIAELEPDGAAAVPESSTSLRLAGHFGVIQAVLGKFRVASFVMFAEIKASLLMEGGCSQASMSNTARDCRLC